MDIAAFKVGHSVDKDAALQAKSEARNVPSGRWNVTHGFDSRESSPPATTHIAKVSIPVGRWSMGVGSIWRKTHGALPRHTASSEHTIGAMDESSGKGSMIGKGSINQAHISSGVIMDIATFKVRHSVGPDNDATTLQAKKRRA